MIPSHWSLSPGVKGSLSRESRSLQIGDLSFDVRQYMRCGFGSSKIMPTAVAMALILDDECCKTMIVWYDVEAFVRAKSSP